MGIPDEQRTPYHLQDGAIKSQCGSEGRSRLSIGSGFFDSGREFLRVEVERRDSVMSFRLEAFRFWSSPEP